MTHGSKWHCAFASAVAMLLLTVISVPSWAQDDACKTIQGRRARCEHPGRSCDGGAGSCVFQSGDGICGCVDRPPNSPPTLTGVVGNGLAAPVFVNLYWDTNWDAHNPTMTESQLDGFMTALLKSSYFGRLGEYGVGSPTYGGGFLPAAHCTPQAPSNVGFYDPVNASIIGFLQCELDYGDVPQGSQVVYNVILPAGSIESDFAGADQFCVNGPAVAWHFHQTPYSPQAVIGIGAAVLGASTGGVPGALVALTGALGALQGGPLYTISSADPRCGSLTRNLLHEIVEAASDPYPPPSVVLSGTGEIVDICDDKRAPPSNPFVPPVTALPRTSFPTSAAFTSTSTISAPQYWSNSGQTCSTGYTNTQVPGVQAQSISITGNGAGASFVLSGNGFGTLPAPLSVPTSSALPYIAIQNATQGWQAGNSLNADAVTLNTASWSNSITINGFNFSSGNLIMKPGDNLVFWVCNPASGNCAATGKPLAGSGDPELKVFMINTNAVNLSYDIYIDGNKVAGPLADGDTGWLTLSTGSHSVAAKQTSPGTISTRYVGACDASGHVTLNPGDNTTCSIINIASAGCPTGQHCCSTPTTSSGCPTGCISDSIACTPLCTAPANRCCGGARPNGQCDGRCIKSPPESCD